MSMIYKYQNKVSASGDVSLSSEASQRTLSNTGNSFVINKTQNIGTSAEALDKGDITNIRGFDLINLDASNYVEISLDAGTTYIAKVYAGQKHGLHLCPDSQTNVHVRANGAACDVVYSLISSS